MFVLKQILVLLLNVIIYYILQVIEVFVVFGIWGSGATSDRNSNRLTLFLILLQIGFNIWLFIRKKLITNIYFLIINIVMLLFFFVYFVIYIPMTIEGERHW